MNDFLTNIQREAVTICLSRNIPFVLFALPGEDECRFFASLPAGNGQSPAPTDRHDGFFISRYASDEPYMAGVASAITAEQLIHMHSVAAAPHGSPSLEHPYRTSTRRGSYSRAFGAMTTRLKKSGGKVVLSRHESMFSTRTPLEVFETISNGESGAFRYLCFTPETGVWLGATPELLLMETGHEGEIATMALAGTRLPGESGEWDGKNMAEHQMVVGYITGILEDNAMEVHISPTEELDSGRVVHLCTRISATGQTDFTTLLSALNPTPAVAGVPLDLAIGEIDIFETHQRRCYSGAVGVCLGGLWHAFVNLRCAFAARASYGKESGWLYNLYAGGGLLADSDEDTEWTETENKSAPLRAALGKDAIHNPSNAVFTDAIHTSAADRMPSDLTDILSSPF